MSAPLVSIVTATLDAAPALRSTIDSIAAQRGASFEWWVMDGGSRDATAELLRAAGPLAQWRSEPDAGLYDAWNKALALARGEWLLFLGAGDELAPGALQRFEPILRRAFPVHGLVYGNLAYLSERERTVIEETGSPWPELQGRWEIGRPALPPHPALFHHRSLFAAGGFDTRFRLAADSHFVLRRLKEGAVPLYVPQLVCRAPIGGMTFRLGSARALAREISQIDRELGIVPPLGHRVGEWLLLGAKGLAARLPAPLGRRLADAGRRLLGRPRRWGVP